MMKYSYTWTELEKNPKQAKQLIGINYENFIQLISIAQKIDKNYRKNVEEQKFRLSRPGRGAKQKLLVEDQILLTLIYLRQNLTFQVLGYLFQVSKSTAHNYFSYWPNIFRFAFKFNTTCKKSWR